MRTFGTIIFGLIFIVAFQGYFLAHSVSGYPLSTAAVVETAEGADLYGTLMETIDLAMQEAVRQADHKALATEVAGGLGGALKEAIPKEWFYETFEKAYSAFVAYIEHGEDNTEIDLSEQKQRIKAYFDGLIAKYSLGQGDAQVQREMNEALKVVPDKITIGALFAKMGGDARADEQLEQLRDKIAEARTYTLIGLGVLLGLLVLLCLIAMKTPKRFLISIGVIFALSGGLYLAVTHVGTNLLIEEVRKDQAANTSASSEAEEFGQKKAMEVTEVLVTDAVQRSNTLVSVIFLLGLAMFIGGFFARDAAPSGPSSSGREMYGAA